jgi:hypothetical protein
MNKNHLTVRTKHDGEPLTIYAQRVTPNVVVVTVLVGNPSEPLKRQEHGDPTARRLYGGASFCHPNDEFDMLEGVKQACKNALEINNTGWHFPTAGYDRRRAIYRACREAIADQKLHDEIDQLGVRLGVVTGTSDVQDALAAVLAAIRTPDWFKKEYENDPDPHPLP